jgi:hypothetical protein
MFVGQSRDKGANPCSGSPFLLHRNYAQVNSGYTKKEKGAPCNGARPASNNAASEGNDCGYWGFYSSE